MSRKACLSFLLVILVGALLLSCNNDEENLRPPPPSATIINVEFENAKVIEVNSERHQALLLTTAEGATRRAIQYVDLASRTMIASRILTDYLDVYDVKFVSDTLACFAGRPHGHIGYAVQFVSLPSLLLTTRVMVILPDTSGNAGYLALDSAGSFVYYSHAGGGDHDGVYKIRVSNRQLVDADNDGQTPFGFDNQLVEGLFDGPAKLFYDDASGKIVVANPEFITMINGGLWETLNRADSLTFAQVSGVSHLSTQAGANADMMAHGETQYVFGGGAINQPTLSMFRTASTALDLANLPLPRVAWWHNNSAIFIHPREDVASVFVIYEDSAGVAIGQYGLEQLNELAQSPYRTRTIPDTSISTFGLDIISNRLIIADKDHPRLELIGIE